MGGHIVIVDRDPARRAALRDALGLSPGEVREIDHPALLPVYAATGEAGLAFLDLGMEDAALDALRRMPARQGRPLLPVIALVPSDRPDLRRAALLAGAEEARSRETAPCILRACIQSLRHDREEDLDMWDEEEPAPVAPTGLAEPPAPFLAAPRSRPSRIRLALLAPQADQGLLPAEGLARLLDAEVVSLPTDVSPEPETPDIDLVVIDALGASGDVPQGTRVLRMLAELRGRPATGDAATLVLLPACAVETAALALGLGADGVAAAPLELDEIALRARAALSRKAHEKRRRERVRSLCREAGTDVLTGLPNRRHADARLRRMADAARREGRRLAVLMLDVNRFKSVNDRHGHAAGDQVLIEVANRLEAALRPGDLLARYGGDEFLAALPDATLAEAQATAERLRQAVADRDVLIEPDAAETASATTQGFDGPPLLAPVERHRGQGPIQLSVTISLGVAVASASELASGLTPKALRDRADQVLVALKRAGRRDMVAAAPVLVPWGTASPAEAPLRAAPLSPSS